MRGEERQGGGDKNIEMEREILSEIEGGIERVRDSEIKW